MRSRNQRNAFLAHTYRCFSIRREKPKKAYLAHCSVLGSGEEVLVCRSLLKALMLEHR